MMSDRTLLPLVRAAQAGARHALDDLCRRLRPQVARVVRRTANDEDIQHEAEQVALLNIAAHLGGYRELGEGSFHNWVSVIARRAVISAARCRRLQPLDTDFEDAAELEEAPSAHAPGYDLLVLQTAAAVMAGVDELYRPLLAMSVAGMTYNEMARRSGLCLNTIRTRLWRGRQQAARVWQREVLCE